MHHTLLTISGLALTAALSSQTPDPATGQPLPQNVLVIVGDDIGVDRVGSYGYTFQGQPISGPTPVLDGLAANGVRFENAWANPWCSPTRATIMTGRYGFRTGAGIFVSQNPTMPKGPGMRDTETCIPDVLPPAYRSAAVGKWHLADMGPASSTSGPDHPIRCGFEYHAGSFANIRGNLGQTYTNWPKYTSTTTTTNFASNFSTYATTDTTNEAIGQIQAFGNDPWFLYVAYNSPHVPLHAPPANLHTQNLAGTTPANNPIPHVKAMIEAMDKEIGRLLRGISPAVLARTTVVFVGDNGTVGAYTESPFDPTHGKATNYNGGLNVPLIVYGAAVAPAARNTVCDGLVNTTDLFATVAELAGAAPSSYASGVDAESIVPYLSNPSQPSIRSFAFAEWFDPNFTPPASAPPRQVAIRDNQYKLIINAPGTPPEFYDIIADYFETNNLLQQAGGLTPAQQAVFASLVAEVRNLQ